MNSTLYVCTLPVETKQAVGGTRLALHLSRPLSAGRRFVTPLVFLEKQCLTSFKQVTD